MSSNNKSKKNNKKSKEKPTKKKAPLEISESKKEECGGDKECLSQMESMTLEDVYGSKGNTFGSMLIFPSLAPPEKFKPRCRGTKRYKIYEKVDNKKRSGIKLKSIPKSLLKPLETESDCFFEGKNLEAKKELGKTCKKDEDCLSGMCSSIKLLGTKGKCILPPSTGSAGEGSKCEYEEDCKTGLSCEDNICVIKKDELSNKKNEKKDKKGKKEKKGILGNFVGRFTKKKFNESNNNTNLNLDIFNSNNSNECLSQDKIASLIQNDKYVSFKDYTNCNNDNCSKDCGAGSYCFNNECYHIAKKCNFQKECLKDAHYKNPLCCDKEHFCKTQMIDDEKESFCEPLENVTNLKNGFYCLKDNNCKSNFCNKNLDKCMSKKMKNLNCKSDHDCIYNEVYGNKYNGCVSNVCYDYKKFPKKTRKLAETCYKDKDCKNKNCGRKKLPYPYMYTSKSFIKKCMPKEENKEEINEFINAVKKRLDENKVEKLDLKSSINNLQNYKYIYFENTNNKYSNENRNNVVIFREDKNYKLGKLQIQQNDDKDIYTILYFDTYGENYTNALEEMRSHIDTIEGNYANALKEMKCLSSNKNDIFVKDFKKKGKSKDYKVKNNWHLGSDALKIGNSMVFDCLCLMFFGESKIILDVDDFESTSTKSYFQLNEELYNFDDSFDKDYVYEMYDGDLIQLSIPFRKDDITGNVSGVSNNNVNIDEAKNFILKSSYVEISREKFYKLNKFGHFNLRFNSRGKLTIDKKINVSNKTKFKFSNITNNSIFAQLIN